MRSVGVVLAATAAISAANPSLRSEAVPTAEEAMQVLHESLLPEEWKDAKVTRAEVSVFDQAARSLAAMAGYNQGVGFLKYTGFSDKECLHPKWETGMQIGHCMKVESEGGGGSFRATHHRFRDVHKVKVERWHGSDMCQGAPDEVTYPIEQKAGCHRIGTTVDDTGRLFSGMYSFDTMNDFRFIDFNGDRSRGIVEFTTGEACDNWTEEGPEGVNKFYFQVVPSWDACHQTTTSTGVVSYRTMCHYEHNDGGVGRPMNVWYEDDACMHQTEPLHTETFGQCQHPGDPDHAPIFGGARVYHSRRLPRGPQGTTTRELCFAHDGEGRGAELENRLTPWNGYKDIRYHHDDEGGQGHNPYVDCSGGHCYCNGYMCIMQGGAQCEDSGCVCIGDQCQCSTGDCSGTPSTSTCWGDNCGCTGESCVFLGHLAGNSTSLMCDPYNDHHCLCLGSSCSCLGSECVCQGMDCGCMDTTQSCMQNYASCVGEHCHCNPGSDDCHLMGFNSHCTDNDCHCFGEDCRGGNNM